MRTQRTLFHAFQSTPPLSADYRACTSSESTGWQLLDHRNGRPKTVEQERTPCMMILAVLTSVLPLAALKPWENRADPPASRAAALLKAMTQEEKYSMLHGPPTGPCCQCTTNASCAYVGNINAIPRLKIPPITMNDGPQGFRDNNNPGSTTAWPSGLTMAASWDTDAMEKWGVGMGKEFFAKGSNVQLGPGLCLARVPRNGRNFEYLSGEDPILGYVLSQPAIKGIQSQGVIANAKHYVMNDQETNRGSVSEDVDERTRYQLYYPPFAGALDADVGSIMCSYNKINGQGDPTPRAGAKTGFIAGHWSCENPVTLGHDLKENGAGGVVGKDWSGFVMGATHSTSIKQGLDVEMPGAGWMNSEKIGAQLAAGIIDQAVIDASVTRILTTMFKYGVMDKPEQWDWKKLSENVTTASSVEMARYLSAESHVLIKNEGILPLNQGSPGKKVAIFGLAAPDNAIVHGGGSGSVVPSYIVSPLEGLQEAWGIPPSPPAANNCSEGNYLVGYDYYNQDGQKMKPTDSVTDCCAACAQEPGCVAFSWTHKDGPGGGRCFMKSSTDNLTPNKGVTCGICKRSPISGGSANLTYTPGFGDHDRAAAESKDADISIVFVGTLSHEGGDRRSLSLDDGGPEADQNALIEAVAAANPNTVVVMAVPGAILMPWADKVKAIVTNFMPGQQAGGAIADVLTGKVNPSGKLPLTFPNKENEIGFTTDQWPGYGNSSTGQSPGFANYSEKLLVGYRYYDAKGIEFTTGAPFGHGLSYSTFRYSDIAMQGRNVTFTVENTGSVAGKEVCQVYASLPKVGLGADEPPKRLVAFSKVALAVGAKTSVSLELSDYSLSVWDDQVKHAFEVLNGNYNISVGSSSRDIRGSTSLRI